MLEYTRFGARCGRRSAGAGAAIISGISIERVGVATFALGNRDAGLAGVLVAPAFAIDPQLAHASSSRHSR